MLGHKKWNENEGIRKYYSFTEYNLQYEIIIHWSRFFFYCTVLRWWPGFCRASPLTNFSIRPKYPYNLSLLVNILFFFSFFFKASHFWVLVHKYKASGAWNVKFTTLLRFLCVCFQKEMSMLIQQNAWISPVCVISRFSCTPKEYFKNMMFHLL